MVDVSGAHSFSYLEEWSPIVLQDRKCTESVSSRKSHLRTVKILQNAFSHIMFLCPQRSDRAEKPETRNTRFSRQCALKTLLSGFGLKAFRKFTMKSAWGNIPDWCREGKPLFARSISLESSATPCLIVWLRWKSSSWHTDHCAGAVSWREVCFCAIMLLSWWNFTATRTILPVYAPLAVP